MPPDRLINRDVPQEVIRVLLDHESTHMIAHYAKITDKTVRRRREAATKVNIKGERVDLEPFSDKQLPGKTINNPLHRLVPSYSDANNTRVNSNRYYAKAWGCNPYFPNWNVPVEYPPEYPQGRPVQECDEYPFASTYEGAARWKTDGDQYKNMFSAKPVYWRDNQAAGTLLGNWYDWDRIAEHQAFYIKVD